MEKGKKAITMGQIKKETKYGNTDSEFARVEKYMENIGR